MVRRGIHCLKDFLNNLLIISIILKINLVKKKLIHRRLVDITEDKCNIMEDKTMAEDSKEAAEKIEQIELIDEDESL